jgi:hypothetical protein
MQVRLKAGPAAFSRQLLSIFCCCTERVVQTPSLSCCAWLKSARTAGMETITSRGASMTTAWSKIHDFMME